jgi:acyl-CoA thioesterase FadM
MFKTQTNVKLHDTDAAGILFFSNHFRIAHTAYEDFMQ